MSIDFDRLKERAGELAQAGVAKAREITDAGMAKAKQLTEIGKLKMQISWSWASCTTPSGAPPPSRAMPTCARR